MTYTIRETYITIAVIFLALLSIPMVGQAAADQQQTTLQTQIAAAQAQLNTYYQQQAAWMLQGHSLNNVQSVEVRMPEQSDRAEIRMVTDEGTRHYLNLIAPSDTNDRTITGMWSTLFTLLMLHYDYAAITTDQAVSFLEKITWQD